MKNIAKFSMFCLFLCSYVQTSLSLATVTYIMLLLLCHVLGQTARDRTTAHKMADPLTNC